ncbi:MAG TPA: S41 family peptidase, partial [Chitinophagaceae bacterium]|nr:S41 family peptidase [Chitinophagaceae bacterium]
MRSWLILFSVVFITGCGVGRSSVSPYKKFSPQQLKHDFSVYRTMMEESHPSLYWYTSKDSIDHYFQIAESEIKDSMTEPAFRKVLAWMTSKFGCGHTAVRAAANVSRFTDTARLRVFPLSVKIWPATTEQKRSYQPRDDDFMAVAANLNRRDTVFKRGTLIRAINGRPVNFIIDTLFEFMTTDGYNRTHKYQTLSNRGSFGSLYTAIFGLSEKYTIDYLDASAQLKTAIIPAYDPVKDTAGRTAIRQGPRPPQPSRKQRKQDLLVAARQLKIDSVNHTAFLTLNSFGRGYRLKKFFRHVFLELRKNKISHFIVDVRGNGGGSVTNSTFLTRFLADHRFKIADSLYAPRKKSTYGHYLSDDFFNRLFMTFFCKKKSDGNYHFGYFERHYFKPKKAR